MNITVTVQAASKFLILKRFDRGSTQRSNIIHSEIFLLHHAKLRVQSQPKTGSAITTPAPT